MAEDKLRRLNNLMIAAQRMIEELSDSGDLRGEGELFTSSAELIIALHEMGREEYGVDPDLVEEAYRFAFDHGWFDDDTGFPVDNPFEKESE